MAQKTKAARLDIRLTNEQKHLFEYVAALEGKKLTELIVIAMQKYALSSIDEQEKMNKILAGKKDQEIFIQALLNPEGPNEALKKAAENYKKQID